MAGQLDALTARLQDDLKTNNDTAAKKDLAELLLRDTGLADPVTANTSLHRDFQSAHVSDETLEKFGFLQIENKPGEEIRTYTDGNGKGLMVEHSYNTDYSVNVKDLVAYSGAFDEKVNQTVDLLPNGTGYAVDNQSHKLFLHGASTDAGKPPLYDSSIADTRNLPPVDNSAPKVTYDANHQPVSFELDGIKRTVTRDKAGEVQSITQSEAGKATRELAFRDADGTPHIGGANEKNAAVQKFSIDPKDGSVTFVIPPRWSGHVESTYQLNGTSTNSTIYSGKGLEDRIRTDTTSRPDGTFEETTTYKSGTTISVEGRTMWSGNWRTGNGEFLAPDKIELKNSQGTLTYTKQPDGKILEDAKYTYDGQQHESNTKLDSFPTELFELADDRPPAVTGLVWHHPDGTGNPRWELTHSNLLTIELGKFGLLATDPGLDIRDLGDKRYNFFSAFGL